MTKGTKTARLEMVPIRVFFFRKESEYNPTSPLIKNPSRGSKMISVVSVVAESIQTLFQLSVQTNFRLSSDFRCPKGCKIYEKSGLNVAITLRIPKGKFSSGKRYKKVSEGKDRIGELSGDFEI
jgi:hypothetical protein